MHGKPRFKSSLCGPSRTGSTFLGTSREPGHACPSSAHAPRAWYDRLTGTLRRIGWRQVKSDKCIFILKDDAPDENVSVAGIHVDDVLIGGQDGHEKFERCFKQLQEAYRWGKWEQDDFKFTGCRVQQSKDFQIRTDQQEYTDIWIEEIHIEEGRMHQRKSTATPKEVSLLREQLERSRCVPHRLRLSSWPTPAYSSPSCHGRQWK